MCVPRWKTRPRSGNKKHTSRTLTARHTCYTNFSRKTIPARKTRAWYIFAVHIVPWHSCSIPNLSGIQNLPVPCNSSFSNSYPCISGRQQDCTSSPSEFFLHNIPPTSTKAHIPSERLPRVRNFPRHPSVSSTD